MCILILYFSLDDFSTIMWTVSYKRMKEKNHSWKYCVFKFERLDIWQINKCPEDLMLQIQRKEETKRKVVEKRVSVSASLFYDELNLSSRGSQCSTLLYLFDAMWELVS